ncbi:adaptor protein, partial [Bacillus cereus]|nr:adaptor protein [Bacillus cereus]
STATIYRIMEYGKELMDVNAIEQIHNYFVKKQNLS